MESIKAAEKALGDVFCDKYVFHIPPYQRPYSWGKEQVDELLDDLIWAAGSDAPPKRPPYFLGSVVLIKKPEYPDADVVDGQQRLTTLTILISVLRELAENADERANIDIFLRQRGNPNLGTVDIPRLTVRPRDADFFRKVIQEGGQPDLADADSTDARRRMLENRDYLRDRLLKMSPAVRSGLLPFAAQRCFLVVVEASDQASAYRIFSVMNDRGLDLSPTDILKADIIGAIDGEEEQAKYNETWESLEDGLGREAFRDLFAHIRMIHRKQKMRGTLEREFNEYVNPKAHPVDFIEKELKPSAVAFEGIIHPDPRRSKRYRIIQALSRLDNQDWQPAAISFLVRENSDPAKVDAFMLALERLAYFLFITRANINNRLTRYGQLLSEIEAGIALDQDSALQLSEDEAWELFETLDGSVYENQRTRKPILLKLDEVLSDGTAHYEHELITIEHVLPQNPAEGSEWLELFPDDEFRENWVHSLANLVLLSRYKNPAASNFDFDYKKTKYFADDGDSPFVLTNQVRDTSEWTPEVLATRQYDLMGKLAAYWQLDEVFKDYVDS
ncbi:MAG: DUF262 domain-containing protein [Cypionkella sp.]